MSTLNRVKALLHNHGYVESEKGENEGENGTAWERGDRWIKIKETSPEVFELFGNCIHQISREVCNCGKEYVFTCEGDYESEDVFFDCLNKAFILHVYHSPTRQDHKWRDFPIDTPRENILHTIDLEYPEPRATHIGYHDGYRHVQLRKE